MPWYALLSTGNTTILAEGSYIVKLLKKRSTRLTYPKHKHSPEELYIVLAGKIWWETENVKSSPVWKHAGDVIHHPPNQTHAVTAGDEPVLILNLWKGGSFEMPEIV